MVPFVALFLYWAWQRLELFFFLLLFTLPFSFEYSFSSTLSTDLPDELIMLLVSAGFFFYWVYRPPSLPRQVLRHPLIIGLIFLLCWTAIAVIFSTNIFPSIKYLLSKSWYLGAFVLAPLMVFREKQMMKSAAVTLGFSMLIVTLWIMLRHWGTGFRFYGINAAAAPFFRNHVNYSAMLVCVIPIFLAFHRLARSSTQKYLLAAAIAILIVALFFSYARGGWIALGAGLITYWLIRKKLLSGTYILGIIMSLAFLFWVKSDDRYLRLSGDYNTTVFHSNFREHLIATYQLKDVSTAERLYRWVAGVRMIKDRWQTGYGPGAFYSQYKPYTVPGFKTWVSANYDHSTVHNYFLLLAIEQGIPGLVIFLVLLGLLLFYAQYLYHRVADIFYRTIAITCGVILVMIIVVNLLSDLIETDKIGSLFFLCLSTLVITDTRTRKMTIHDSKAGGG